MFRYLTSNKIQNIKYSSSDEEQSEESQDSENEHYTKNEFKKEKKSHCFIHLRSDTVLINI